MIQQKITVLKVPTKGRGFYEITEQVQGLIDTTGWKTGVVNLIINHTSASLLIQENADPQVRDDLERFFEELAPDGSPLFKHRSEGPDDMPAHIRSALTTVSLSIPIQNGRMALGTWQGIYLWEHRHLPHHRQIVLHLLGE